MKKIILLVILCLITTFNAFSQAETITENEYWKQYHAANEKPFENSRRIITKTEYKGENSSYTREIVDEFLNPNKRRYVEIYKSGNRTERDELIQIGEAYYCRTNDGIWKKSNQWCGELRISSLPMATSSKFTIEDTKINNQAVKLYQQYITYKNEYSSNKAKEGLSYFQDKFWVDSNGFILRREWELGLLEPKKTYETMVTIYEYNPKDLKIEAPKMTRKKS